MGRVILVRHGQASFGAADYDQLSPLGAEQGATTGVALAARGLRPDLLIQGGLRRHDQTTRALVAGAGWADVPIRTSLGWDEIDHLGVMTAHGETPHHEDPRAFQAAYERALHRWMAEAPGPPGPEPFMAFTRRVLQELRHAADEAGPGRTVVVVTSAGPVGVACASLMRDGAPGPTQDRSPGGMDDSDPGPMHDGSRGADQGAWMRWNAVAVNCALTTVLVGRSGTRLLSFNEHGHLAPASVTFR